MTEEVEVEAPQIVVVPVIRPRVQELEPKPKVSRRKVRLVSFSQFGAQDTQDAQEPAPAVVQSKPVWGDW